MEQPTNSPSSASKPSLPQANPENLDVANRKGANDGKEEEAVANVTKATFSPRTIRRFYKVTLAQVLTEWEEGLRVGAQNDCLRCLLTERGAFMISGPTVSTCTLPVPEGQITITEAELQGRNPSEQYPYSLQCYMETMALSTAVGATVDTRVNLANDPPATRVVERRMDQDSVVLPSSHKCIEIQRPKNVLRVDSRYILRGDKLLDAEQRYAVIYAAPGFGKTTLQHRLASRGVIVADTDDVPSATRHHVSQLLKWTSVLTNRLDLLDPEFPTVVFVPANVQVLRKRGIITANLTDEDMDYWYKLHHFPNHRRIVKCIVDRSGLTDWICVVKWPTTPHETRIGPAFEAEFLQKIRDLGGATH